MTWLSKGHLFVTDSVEAIPHSSERVGASRIPPGGKDRGAEGDGATGRGGLLLWADETLLESTDH